MKRLLIIMLIMNILFSFTSKGNKNNQENNKIKSESVSLLTESTDMQENNALTALHTEESVNVDSIRDDFINKFKSKNLEGGDTVRCEKHVKISEDGKNFLCATEFTIKRNNRISIYSDVNYYSISSEGIIKESWSSAPEWYSDYSEQIPKKSNEHVLLDMVLASTDSMYQTFRVSNFPIKKINDSVYAISVFHKWISYGKYQLSFDLYEGYVALHQYNISDGSYVYLVSILEGETYNCYPYLYKNGKFTCINLFWGYDHPLEYIWSDSLVNSHIDGQDFYDMSFDINGPNTIRVELMDDRMPKENPGCFLGDYVDYAFDSVKGQMVKQKIGWKDDLKTK